MSNGNGELVATVLENRPLAFGTVVAVTAVLSQLVTPAAKIAVLYGP